MRLSAALLALFCLPALADEPAPASEMPAPAPAPQAATVPLAPMTLPTPVNYGVLVVSRERLEVTTPCEIGLYLQGNLTARLFQGQSIALNLPPGDVQIRLGQIGERDCQPRFEQLRGQTLRVTAGEVVKYRIAMGSLGLQLIPAPLNY